MTKANWTALPIVLVAATLVAGETLGFSLSCFAGLWAWTLLLAVLLTGCGCMRTDEPAQDNNTGMTDDAGTNSGTTENNGTNGSTDPNTNGTVNDATTGANDADGSVNGTTGADENGGVLGGAVDEGLEAGENALDNAADDLTGNSENAKARN